MLNTPSEASRQRAADLIERAFAEAVALVGRREAEEMMRAATVPEWQREGRRSPGRKKGALGKPQALHFVAYMIEHRQHEAWWKDDEYFCRVFGDFLFALREDPGFQWVKGPADNLAVRRLLRRAMERVRADGAGLLMALLSFSDAVRARMPDLADKLQMEQQDWFLEGWRQGSEMAGLTRLPLAARTDAFFDLIRAQSDK